MTKEQSKSYNCCNDPAGQFRMVLHVSEQGSAGESLSILVKMRASSPCGIVQACK